MIPDYPLGQMISKQINENRMDIEPNLSEALLNYNLKNNLEKSSREKYNIINKYFNLYPNLDEPPTTERIEHLISIIST